MKYSRLIFSTIVLMFCNSILGLVPIDSIVLGEFNANYSEIKNDPLEFIFGRDQAISGKDFESQKNELALYRGFYQEGKNLENSCKETRKIEYRNDWEKIQVMRAISEELQYIILDLSTRSIPLYAKFFDFTKDEYSNLANDLVDNYCSENLTLISKRELKNNLFLKFDKANSFQLPGTLQNSFFPKSLMSKENLKIRRKNEFYKTIELFKSACSYSGNPMHLGPMLPILKNPAIMAFVIRQMSGKKIAWSGKDRALILENDPNTVKVWCDHLICRKTNNLDFSTKVVFSLGGTNLKYDFEGLYCQDFQMMDYDFINLDSKIVKMIKDRTFDDENFLAGQLIALITGVPDFLLGLNKFSDGKEIFLKNIDHYWENWSLQKFNTSSRELYYEEPMTLELIERKKYYSPHIFDFKLIFDANLGEFDRVNQKMGKLNLSFELTLPINYIIYHKNALFHLGPHALMEKEWHIKRLENQIKDQLSEVKDKLLLPPWSSELSRLISDEISEQIELMDNNIFPKNSKDLKKIRVEINYGPFALRYLYHHFQGFIKNSKAMTLKENSDTIPKYEEQRSKESNEVN